MFGKKKRKVECMICGENIENRHDAYVSYLKVNGHIGIYFLHKECEAKAHLQCKKINNIDKNINNIKNKATCPQMRQN